MHKHHIIPRHMGGTDHPSNLIELTIEEHAEAHRKLWEEHHKRQDFIAWRMLSGQITAEQAIIESVKHANTGLKRSKEFRENLRLKRLGKNNHFYGKTHKQETKNQMRILKLGKPLSKSHKETMSKLRKGKDNAFFGKQHSETTKSIMSSLKKGKSWSIDPETGKRKWKL